jgi:hypothetical protein
LIRAVVKKEKRTWKQLYLVKQMTKSGVHSRPGEIEGLKCLGGRRVATDDDRSGTKEREIALGRDSAAGLEDG